MSTEPITGLTYQEPGSLQTDALQNAELNYYGAWLNCVVLSVGDTAAPGSPLDGDRYIVGTSATGVWATHDDKLAVYRDGWQFYDPIEGVAVRNLDDASDWIFEGSAGWSVKAGGGASAWGGITGTLSAQTDLQSALDAKLALAGGSLTGALNEAKGADIASAGTTNIAAATGNFVHITGTTTITALGTAQAGTRRILVFDGALLLTHNATSLILPTGANITTAAGDAATMVSEGSGNWRCINYQRKDGTSLAGGGGGLTNFTEGVNTASPNATAPYVYLIPNNGATRVDVALVPKSVNGAFSLAVADGTATGGNKRGTAAVDLQLVRANATYVASGASSALIGGESNTTAGASATNAGGNGNSVSASRAFNGGGQSNTVSGVVAANVGGASNTASANGAVTLGGSANTASGLASVAHGTIANTRSIYNARAAGCAANNQILEIPLYVATTNATPTILRSDSAAAAATNQYALPSNRAARVRVIVIARQSAGTGTGDVASWDFGVTLKNIAGTTSIVGTPSTAQSPDSDAGAAAWAVAVAANNTLDTLEITVTGEASKTIQWTAYVIGPES